MKVSAIFYGMMFRPALFPFKGGECGISPVVVHLKHEVTNEIRELLSLVLVKLDVPGSDQIGVETGEAVPGRTDGHDGEVEFCDGPRVDGGGDWADGPTGERLGDHTSSCDEASDDDRDPEESDETSGGGDVD